MTEHIIRTIKELEQEAIIELKALQGEGRDVEGCHGEADKIITSLLIDLGFIEVVKEYELIEKWYA
jgi:hypothetical protein